MLRRKCRVAIQLIIVGVFLGSLMASPASAHADWLCDADAPDGSDWDIWEMAGSQFIHYRACIDHTSSDVLGKTQVFITWNDLNVPEFEYLGLVTQIQKNTGTWTTITSNVCDRTSGENPGDHDTPGTAFNCSAPNANRTTGNWRVRQNVCWDLTNTAFKRLTDTAAGFNFSPTHAL